MSQDDYFPFFACIEDAGLKGLKADQVDKVAHECAVHAGVVPSKLMDCYKGTHSCTVEWCLVAAGRQAGAPVQQGSYIALTWVIGIEASKSGCSSSA